MTQSPSDAPLSPINPPAAEAPAPMPDPGPPRTESGVPIIHAAGLRSAVFAFGFQDGLLLRASVHDEQVRRQWKDAGEQASAAALRNAQDAKGRALAEHEPEVS